MEHLAQVLNGRGLTRGAIACELDNYYYSAAADQALRSGLGRDRIIDATGLVNWQRSVKSPAELAYMRIAGSIMEKVFERVMAKLPAIPRTAEPFRPHRDATR